jgi:cysteine synthase
MKFNNILDTIGNTPLVLLPRYSTPKVKIYAKLEGVNPSGSIKDRIALYMITRAETQDLLNKDKIIIEATSGNTGIALAMISVIKGYKFTSVMPESVSIERRKLLEAYGAEIILTDGLKGTNYALEVAKNIAKEDPERYIMLNQFANKANIDAHYFGTGSEIIKDLPKMTHFVAGMGTGGTLTGVGRKLKEVNQNIQIVGIEPLAGSKIQGLRNMVAYKPEIFDMGSLDEKITIEEDNIAFDLARDLFKMEGISVGISSGAALWGAMQIGERIEEGNIVTIFPDCGDKYLSTELFS